MRTSSHFGGFVNHQVLALGSGHGHAPGSLGGIDHGLWGDFHDLT